MLNLKKHLKLYLEVKLNGKKFVTSIEVHMNAGGDRKVFEAWEESQKNKEYFNNE